MSSLRLASSTARAALSLSRGCKSTTTTQTLTTKRTFSSLPHLRPSIIAPNGAVFRPCNSGNTLLSRLPPTTTSPAGITNAPEGVLDIVPKSAITAHPALAGPQQIRCGPRPTMARSSRLGEEAIFLIDVVAARNNTCRYRHTSEIQLRREKQEFCLQTAQEEDIETYGKRAAPFIWMVSIG
ncbi:hypothetical protein CHU98_g1107 [Xylaria longipes]|nr:hypothetical protein CHU98_g1107 [Xylaria longipes]